MQRTVCNVLLFCFSFFFKTNTKIVLLFLHKEAYKRNSLHIFYRFGNVLVFKTIILEYVHCIL